MKIRDYFIISMIADEKITIPINATKINKTSKKKLIVTFAIVIFIFLIGFFVRLDYLRLPGIPDSDKEFYKDQNNLPYTCEFDSYYNYRLTRNFINNGYLGDIIIDGKEWDTHSYYPPGVPMDYPPLLIYIAAFTYKFINLFFNIPLNVVCFWLPVFIGPMAGVVTYFFVKRFSNQYGAIAAGIFTVLSPIYMVRTLPGYFDTDIFIIIFPLAIVWLYIEAVQNKKRKMQVIFATSSAFCMFVFSLAWSGWYYIFYIIFVLSIGYLIWRLIKKRSIKDIGCVLLVFTVGSIFLIGILTGLSNIIKLFYEPLSLFNILNKNTLAPWPNVYLTVAELQRPSARELIADIGVSFIIGVLGLIWILRINLNSEMKKRFSSNITWFFYVFLVVWIIIGFLSTLEGERYTLLLMPPIVISAGIMIGIFTEYLMLLKDNRKNNNLIKKKNLNKIISTVVLVSIILSSMLGMQRILSDIIPTTNDDLWNASEWVKNNTLPETVVISQWSYGHLFTAVADRPVVFDGRMGYIENLSTRKINNNFKYGNRSPSTAREYWIDRALITNNEALSYGILNMLATTGDSAYLILEDYIGSTAKSVEILNDILGLKKETAIKILINKYHLSSEKTQTLINLIYPDKTAPFVLVTTTEIRDKASFILYFGDWNFNKNEGYNYIYSVEDYEIEKDILKSKNGILINNMKIGDADWNGKKPYFVELISENKINREYVDNNSNFCIFIIKHDKKAVVIDKKFENSMFVKLFLEQSGNSYFKLIYRNQSVSVWQ